MQSKELEKLKEENAFLKQLLSERVDEGQPLVVHADKLDWLWHYFKYDGSYLFKIASDSLVSSKTLKAIYEYLNSLEKPTEADYKNGSQVERRYITRMWEFFRWHNCIYAAIAAHDNTPIELLYELQQYDDLCIHSYKYLDLPTGFLKYFRQNSKYTVGRIASEELQKIAAEVK